MASVMSETILFGKLNPYYMEDIGLSYDTLWAHLTILSTDTPGRSDFTILQPMGGPATVLRGMAMTCDDMRIPEGWTEKEIAKAIFDRFDFFSFYTFGLGTEDRVPIMRFVGFTKAVDEEMRRQRYPNG